MDIVLLSLNFIETIPLVDLLINRSLSICCRAWNCLIPVVDYIAASILIIIL